MNEISHMRGITEDNNKISPSGRNDRRNNNQNVMPDLIRHLLAGCITLVMDSGSKPGMTQGEISRNCKK